MIRRYLLCTYIAGLLLGCEQSDQIASGTSLARDKHPAIIIQGHRVFVEGKLLWLGGSMVTWKEAIPGTPRCTEPELIVVCTWDNLGVQIGSGQSDMTKVIFMNINLASREEFFLEKNDFSPRMLFSGYLELDGVSIDGTTEYGAIRGKIDPGRNMTCGIRRCTEPTAVLNPDAAIHLSLNGVGDQSRLYSFSLACKSDESCTDLIPNEG